MARAPKLRTRTTPAKGKYPRQTLAGYYPTKWRNLPAGVRRKNVTIDEALEAFRLEPKADDRFQRIYIYGHHAPYRAGESDLRPELDVLAGSDVRGDAMDALRAAQADYEAQRALIEMDYAPRIQAAPSAVKSVLRREMRRDIAAYEQGLLIEWANVEIKSGAPWRRVAGIWVAE